MKIDDPKVTLPPEEKTKLVYKRMVLSVRSDDLECYQSSETHTRIALDIRVREINLIGAMESIQSYCEDEGMSREITVKAANAFIEVIEQELIFEALRDMMVLE